MHSKANSYRRSSRRNTTPLYLFIFMLIIALWFGFKYHQRQSARFKECEDILRDCTLLEARFRTIGDFFALYNWFTVVTLLENIHYQQNGSYVNINELVEGIGGEVTIDEVAGEIEAFFRRKGMQLYAFINEESYKEYLTDTFGADFSVLGGALDSTRFHYELDLSKNSGSYTLKVFEKQDINLDADAEDYFIYQQPSRTQYVRFKDNARRGNYADFYVQYSSLLADTVDLKN